jgi:hypothetical protein
MRLMATLEEKIKYVLEVSNRLISNDVTYDEEDEEEEPDTCELAITWNGSRVCVAIVHDQEVVACEEAIGTVEAATDLLIRNVLDLLSTRMELDLQIRNKAP